MLYFSLHQHRIVFGFGGCFQLRIKLCFKFLGDGGGVLFRNDRKLPSTFEIYLKGLRGWACFVVPHHEHHKFFKIFFEGLFLQVSFWRRFFQGEAFGAKAVL